MTQLILLLVLFFIIVISLIIGGISLIVYVFQQETQLGVPTLRTSKEDMSNLLRNIEISASDIVYDLGSGNGQTIFLISNVTQSQTHGIELGVVPFLYSSLLKKIGRHRTTLHFKNLLTADISNGTLAYGYLLPHMVKSLEETIDQRMRPGSRVILCDYPFFSKEPAFVSRHKKHTFYIYQL